MYILEESFIISYSSNLNILHILEMLLLSLLVETGQLPGAGLIQADKTCIQLNFYLEILKGGTWVSRGAKDPPAPPYCHPDLMFSFP